MKVLITGASGYVGAKIYEDLQQTYHLVVGTYYNNKINGNSYRIDLTNQNRVNDMIDEINPDVIIHTAADAHSKTCADNPEYAKKINIDSTKYLVKKADMNNTRFIQISTFACFNPQNVYGKTKLEAERIVSKLDNFVILRASLIIGLSPNIHSDNFFNSLLKNLKNHSSPQADISWEFEVTCLHHLSEVIIKLLDKQDIKQVNLPIIANGITTRYKIAKDLFEGFDITITPINQNRVIPLPSIERNILSKYGLPEITYDECIKTIKDDLLNKKLGSRVL